MTRLLTRLHTSWHAARLRATADAERGEITEKVIIVAAAAALAIAAMAAITAAVMGKLDGLQL